MSLLIHSPDKLSFLKKQNFAKLTAKNNIGITFCPNETGGKGAGHHIQKNDIAIGHDKNWLEPTRSKMVKYLTSSGP